MSCAFAIVLILTCTVSADTGRFYRHVFVADKSGCLAQKWTESRQFPIYIVNNVSQIDADSVRQSHEFVSFINDAAADYFEVNFSLTNAMDFEYEVSLLTSDEHPANGIKLRRRSFYINDKIG